jgi:hypothetical protein
MCRILYPIKIISFETFRDVVCLPKYNKLNYICVFQYLGCAMARAVSRRPLTAAAWVRARVNPVGFVVDKVALGQVFLRVLRFSPVNIIALSLIHFIHLFSPGDEQEARKSGRSSVRRQSEYQNTRIAVFVLLISFTAIFSCLQ